MRRVTLLIVATGLIVGGCGGCAGPPKPLAESFVPSNGKRFPPARGEVRVVEGNPVTTYRGDGIPDQFNAILTSVPGDMEPVGGARAGLMGAWSDNEIKLLAESVGANLVVYYALGLEPQPTEVYVENDYDYSGTSGADAYSGSVTVGTYKTVNRPPWMFYCVFYRGKLPEPGTLPIQQLDDPRLGVDKNVWLKGKRFGVSQRHDTWAEGMTPYLHAVLVPRRVTTLHVVAPDQWNKSQYQNDPDMKMIASGSKDASGPRPQELKKLGRAYGAEHIVLSQKDGEFVAEFYRSKSKADKKLARSN